VQFIFWRSPPPRSFCPLVFAAWFIFWRSPPPRSFRPLVFAAWFIISLVVSWLQQQKPPFDIPVLSLFVSLPLKLSHTICFSLPLTLSLSLILFHLNFVCVHPTVVSSSVSLSLPSLSFFLSLSPTLSYSTSSLHVIAKMGKRRGKLCGTSIYRVAMVTMRRCRRLSFVVWHHLVIDLVIILLVNLRIVLVNMLSVVVLFLGSDGSVFRTWLRVELVVLGASIYFTECLTEESEGVKHSVTKLYGLLFSKKALNDDVASWSRFTECFTKTVMVKHSVNKEPRDRP
jgi:hypothetical protein